MKYFDLLKPNIDSFGVITQNANDSWDGGDTVQREGMFMCAMWYHYQAGRITIEDYAEMLSRYLAIIQKLNYDNGHSLRRHPDQSKWYYGTEVMSRDQLTPNLIALGYGAPYILKQFLLKHMLRGMLFTTNSRENGAVVGNNPTMTRMQKIKYALGLYDPGVPCFDWKLPDITDPSIWGAYVRGLNYKLLYPTLLLSDWILVIGALGTYYQTKKGTVTNDQNTQQMLLLQSRHAMPTLVSRLAMWIYKKTNPMNALNGYFSPAGDGPAMNQIYAEIWSDQ
jgi:hypothetical protein